MPKKITLHQFLLRTGKFQKSFEAEQAIRNGEVKVGKDTIKNPRHFINPKTALIFCAKERIIPLKKLYFILNKPRGIICQKSEEEQSIYDFLDHLSLTQEQKSSLFAVGRLDKDTEGLLLITNDGQFSKLLMAPESKVPKTYEAVSNTPLHPSDIKTLEEGVIITTEDLPYKTQPSIVKKTGERVFQITVTEGKKNQIKLMLNALGNEIVHLRRLSIGRLTLGKLAVGEFRQVAKEELLSLCLGNDK